MAMLGYQQPGAGVQNAGYQVDSNTCMFWLPLNSLVVAGDQVQKAMAPPRGPSKAFAIKDPQTGEALDFGGGAQTGTLPAATEVNASQGATAGTPNMALNRCRMPHSLRDALLKPLKEKCSGLLLAVGPNGGVLNGANQRWNRDVPGGAMAHAIMMGKRVSLKPSSEHSTFSALNIESVSNKKHPSQVGANGVATAKLSSTFAMKMASEDRAQNLVSEQKAKAQRQTSSTKAAPAAETSAQAQRMDTESKLLQDPLTGRTSFATAVRDPAPPRAAMGGRGNLSALCLEPGVGVKMRAVPRGPPAPLPDSAKLLPKAAPAVATQATEAEPVDEKEKQEMVHDEDQLGCALAPNKSAVASDGEGSTISEAGGSVTSSTSTPHQSLRRQSSNSGTDEASAAAGGLCSPTLSGVKLAPWRARPRPSLLAAQGAEMARPVEEQASPRLQTDSTEDASVPAETPAKVCDEDFVTGEHEIVRNSILAFRYVVENEKPAEVATLVMVEESAFFPPSPNMGEATPSCSSFPSDRALFGTRSPGGESMASPSSRRRRSGSDEKPPLVAALKPSENAYRPAARSDPSSPAGGRTPADRNVELRRTLQSLLNKVCPESVGTIGRKLAEVELHNSQELELVISLIFKKVVAEPHYCETYADLVALLSGKAAMPEFTAEAGSKPVTFKALLLNVCQGEFESLPTSLKPTGEDLERYGDDVAEIEYQCAQRKKRMLANMKFIGHLFLRQLLSAKIIGSVIQELVHCGQSDCLPEEHVIECTCELLTAIGYTLESMPAGKAAMVDVCKRMSDLKTKKMPSTGKDVYTKRIQFAIQDVLDVRSAGWTKKVFKSAAKTLDEIRKDQEKGDAVGAVERVVVGARPQYIEERREATRRGS